MGKKEIEEMILKLQRTGQLDKSRWLETMDQRIPPSFKKRIVENDKTVLRELIMPNWVTWEFLREWALDDVKRLNCSACGKVTDDFTNFKQVSLCSECLETLKQM